MFKGCENWRLNFRINWRGQCLKTNTVNFLCLGTFSEYTHYVDKVSGRSASPGHLAPVYDSAIRKCVFQSFRHSRCNAVSLTSPGLYATGAPHLRLQRAIERVRIKEPQSPIIQADWWESKLPQWAAAYAEKDWVEYEPHRFDLWTPRVDRCYSCNDLRITLRQEEETLLC